MKELPHITRGSTRVSEPRLGPERKDHRATLHGAPEGSDTVAIWRGIEPPAPHTQTGKQQCEGMDCVPRGRSVGVHHLPEINAPAGLLRDWEVANSGAFPLNPRQLQPEDLNNGVLGTLHQFYMFAPQHTQHEAWTVTRRASSRALQQRYFLCDLQRSSRENNQQ
ncbi:hypothetical protein EYF80_017692 [Liparis tanakae]|uniref:Uncharacterized protein n=1 Tax=Liparis tanakae TaxID=230148 RepID=A0A4Z2I3S1_9TELE|nr:hypothetical protein EYF80_017692 [Liparis tanakae]